MDSRDSSAQPPNFHLQHHHALQPPAHHGVMMIPHSQTQHYSSNTSFMLPSSNNSVAPTTSNASAMHQQNNRFPFNPIAATATKALEHHRFPDGSPSGSGGGWLGIEPVKKKRGRPRKYSPDNSIGLGLSPAPGGQVSLAVGNLESSGGGGTPSSETAVKRSRGRPPGSGKKQLNALGVTGVGFTPHVIMVNSGEDIVSKVMAFSQQGPRTVCILSATGSVCNVSLRQTAMSSVSVSYEGHFDIISLSGSFPASESNSSNSPSGGLSVSLAGSDGRVMGGGLVGTLKAASPVQIIVGSFATERKKQRTPPPPQLLNFNAPATGASPSSGGTSDSGEGGHERYPSMGQPIQSMPMYPAGFSMKMHPTN